MTAELVDLGSSRLHPVSNAIEVQCRGPEVDEGQAPDYGEVPLIQALGVSARPAPSDDDGGSQGVLVDVPGTTGVLVGCTDVRASDNYKELGPGESALHATGKGFNARVLCKDGIVSIVVDDNMTITIDRNNGGSIKMATPQGHRLQLDKDGIAMRTQEGGGIQISGTTIRFEGNPVFGARAGAPLYPVLSPSLVIPSPATGLVTAPGSVWFVG